MIACLMIHGYTGGPYEVEPLADYLKTYTDWDIYVPTLPGHGDVLALEDVSYVSWIETVEQKMTELEAKYDEVYVIGFSMGGMLGGYLAGNHKVDKLVLLAAAGRYLSFRQMTLEVAEAIADGLKGNLEDNDLYRRYKNKAGQIPLEANIEFLKLVRHTRGYLKNVTSPVFIAQGHQDAIVPAHTIKYLDKELGSTHKEIVLFEESDHLICLGENKDALNAMVLEFLRRELHEPKEIEAGSTVDDYTSEEVK